LIDFVLSQAKRRILGGVATTNARPEKTDEALLLLALREGTIDPGIPEGEQGIEIDLIEELVAL
jgi:hypothetical protein